MSDYNFEARFEIPLSWQNFLTPKWREIKNFIFQPPMVFPKFQRLGVHPLPHRSSSNFVYSVLAPKRDFWDINTLHYPKTVFRSTHLSILRPYLESSIRANLLDPKYESSIFFLFPVMFFSVVFSKFCLSCANWKSRFYGRKMMLFCFHMPWCGISFEKREEVEFGGKLNALMFSFDRHLHWGHSMSHEVTGVPYLQLLIERSLGMVSEFFSSIRVDWQATWPTLVTRVSFHQTYEYILQNWGNLPQNMALQCHIWK